MRDIVFGGVIALSTIILFAATADAPGRMDTQTAMISSMRDGASNPTNAPVFWMACDWAAGVYGAVRVCN
jgi:hypothetical protein